MTGLDRVLEKGGLLKFLPNSLRQLHAMLPRLQPHHGGLPTVLPAEGKKRARVALFLGCGGTSEATVKPAENPPATAKERAQANPRIKADLEGNARKAR